MTELIKGDKVHFKKEALKPKTESDYLDLAYLRNENPNQVHIISDVDPNGNVFLEDRGEVLYNSNLFERVCSSCQKKKVFFQMRSLDKCHDCAVAYRDEMLKKFRLVLAPKQRALFEQYYKAELKLSALNEFKLCPIYQAGA